MDLWRLSATELLDGYASGAFSCAEVVADVVAHVRFHNPSLNALVVDLGDEAPSRLGSRRREARGDAPGPLHVPATIKQNIDVSGQPTPNGLPALKDNVAPGRLGRDRQPAPRRRRVRRTHQRARALDAVHDRQPARGPHREPVASRGVAGRLLGRCGRSRRGLRTLHHGNDIGAACGCRPGATAS